MNRFNILMRFGWTFVVALTLSLGLAGCDGDDGSAGAAGAAGTSGTDGQSCWDLNANGVGDLPDEDVNGDGVVDVLDCGAGSDPVAAAIDAAKVESCATCHGDVGVDKHQAVYDQYVDASTFVLTLNSVASVPDGLGAFTVTLDFSITENSMPFVDAAGLPSLGQKRFYAVQYDSATGQYLNGNTRLRETNVVPGAAPGDYILVQTDVPFAPETPLAPFDGAQVYGYIAEGILVEHEGGSGAEIPDGSHVHLYDNVSNDALIFGTANVADANAYESLANVAGCQKCHGTPYLKHGYRDPVVAGLPDFASCKSCHYDDRNGGHTEWQYMVDEPLNWASGVAETADYSYRAKLMNDVHMAHAMEFPYPQSMSNCSTCHEGNLTQLLDDSNFTAETCQSCHPVQGIDAWPEYTDAMDVEHDEGPYFQAHRAPALEWLWTPEGGSDPTESDLSFHDIEAFPDCTLCHGAGTARSFNEIHTGYDVTIYDATGTKYADLNTVSIDQITRSGDTLTITFSSNNPAVVPELLVSFYGWDSKHYIVGSHERDANAACSGFRPGCKMEYTPESSGGGTNPLFTEDAASVPGNWMVTLDMAALQLTKTDDIPTLIANGDVKMAEISITPELDIGGTDVVLTAVSETFDLGGGTLVADYFQGANATVDINKCNVCHDSLASSFHDGSGRGGDGVQVCKNCHTTTFPGSHVEMASRSIDNYVHAIHTFQDFDIGDTFETFDPVLAKRYDQHVKHVFPNFTIRNCEACHLEGKYNVPDQSQSMPGVAASSDTVATWYMIDTVDGSPTEDLALEDPSGRNIGTVPELVTGPASRACGGCHRGRLIRDDAAGDLASFNAHTEAGGTLVENDDDDEVVFGVIDKIMSLFE